MSEHIYVREFSSDHNPTVIPPHTVVNNPFADTFKGSALDFDIATSPIYLGDTFYSNGNTFSRDEIDEDNKECSDKKAIIKLTSEGEVEDWWVVGKDYFVKSHKEFFGAIEEQLLDRFDPNNLEYVVVNNRSSRNGRWGFREYVFNNMSVPIQSTNGHETHIKFRIVAWSGLDGLTSNNYLLGAFDSYCMNGMVWAASENDYSRIKSRNSKLFNLEGFTIRLGVASEEFYKRSVEFQNMAQSKLTYSRGITFLDELKCSDKRKEGFKELYIREMETRGENVFALHSALTNYASHSNDDVFSSRKTKYNDMKGELLFKREEEVVDILRSKEWNGLLEYAMTA